MSIRSPVTQLGTAFADASGTASFSVPVPANSAGSVAWFQAATLLNDFSDATETSNRIRRDIAADPCVGVDCGAGTCDVSQGAAVCLCPVGQVADGLSCVAVDTAVPCDETGYRCDYQEYLVPDTIVGDGSVEVTADIQNFIDSVPDGTVQTPSVVVFPAGSVYWIDGTITLSNRHHLILEGSDSRFEARDPISTGGLTQRNRSQWSISNGSSFITVKHMTVWGAYPGAGMAGVYDVTREAQHAFSVSDMTHDILIDSVWAGYLYGDAIDILSRSYNIVVKNSHFEHMARQGVSVSFGYNVKFVGSYINDAKRSLIDLEPYSSEWVVDHIQFVDNFLGKSGNAMVNIVGDADVILFYGNEVSGVHGLPLVNTDGLVHEAIAFVGNWGEYDNATRVGVDLRNTDGAVVLGNNIRFISANNQNTAVSVTYGEGAVVGDNQFGLSLFGPFVDTNNHAAWVWANSLLDDPAWQRHTSVTVLPGGGFGFTVTGYSDDRVVGGTLVAVLRVERGDGVLAHGGVSTTGELAAVILDPSGQVVDGWTYGGAAEYRGEALDGLNDSVRILQEPRNVTAAAGTPFVMTVAAEGVVPISYQWYRNGVLLHDQTSSTYAAVATIADDGTIYHCVVTNRYGAVASQSVSLTVASVAPEISAHPAGVMVAAGTNATLRVVADGGSPLRYQWQRDGVDISGATAATYITPVAALADDGAAYRVVVSNSHGAITSDVATLSVVEPVLTESWTAADGSPWPARWAISNPAAQNVSVQGGKGEVRFATAEGDVDAVLDPEGGSFDTMIDSDQVVSLFTWEDTVRAAGGLFARRDDADPAVSYSAWIDRTQGGHALRILRGATTIAAIERDAWNVRIWYKLRFQVRSLDSERTELNVKLWQATDAEPGVWTLSVVETGGVMQGRSGRVGVHGHVLISRGRYWQYDDYELTPAGSPPMPVDSLSAVVTNDHLVTVTWTDRSGDELGFMVRRSIDGGAFSDLAYLPADSTFYADTGVGPGRNYRYQVFSVNQRGYASASFASAATPASPTTVLPSNPQYLALAAVSPTEIDLSWSDDSDIESGYRVERSPNGVSHWTLLQTVSSGSTFYADSGLEPSTRYWYRVIAVGVMGFGLHPESMSATTPGLAGSFREFYSGFDYQSWPSVWSHEGDLAFALSIDIFRNTGRYVSAQGSANERVFSYVNNFSAVDAEQTARFTLSANSAGFGLLARRADTAPTTLYYAETVNNAGRSNVQICRRVSGTPTCFATSATYTAVPGVWYRMKFNCADAGGSTLLRAKVWLESDPEPVAWTVEATDSTPGLQGIEGRYGTVVKLFTNGRVVTVDDYTVDEL